MAEKEKHLISNAKFGEGSIIVWGCVASSGIGWMGQMGQMGPRDDRGSDELIQYHSSG